MQQLPSDRILFYISIFTEVTNVSDDDIVSAFPEANINNIFEIEGMKGGYDLQFKDRAEVIKALDCRSDLIKGVVFKIKLSKIIRWKT